MSRNGDQRFRDPLVDELRRIRRGRGMSQAEVAARSGVTMSTIGACELGRNDPGLATLRAWCEALDVDLVLLPRPVGPPSVAATLADLRARVASIGDGDGR